MIYWLIYWKKNRLLKNDFEIFATLFSKVKILFIPLLLLCCFQTGKLYAGYYDGSGHQISVFSGSSSNDNSPSGGGGGPSGNQGTTSSTSNSGAPSSEASYRTPNAASDYTIAASESTNAAREAVEIAQQEVKVAQLNVEEKQERMERAEFAAENTQKEAEIAQIAADKATEIAAQDNSYAAHVLKEAAIKKQIEAQQYADKANSAVAEYKKYEGEYESARQELKTKNENLQQKQIDLQKREEYEQKVVSADKNFTENFNNYDNLSKQLNDIKSELTNSLLGGNANAYSAYYQKEYEWKQAITPLENSFEGLRVACKNLGDYYKEVGYVGDPVLIGTGDYYSQYEDFVAQDYLEKFIVKRELCENIFSDSFGIGWTCSLDSRIVRCVFDDFSERKTLIEKGIQKCKEMENAFDDYDDEYPQFPREETKELKEYARENKKLLEAELKDVNKLIELRNSLLEKNKYCMYGRYNSLDSVYGFEEQLIFLDENGQQYYFQYTDNGKWVAFGNMTKTLVEIHNLNQDRNYSNSKNCAGGYEVCYVDKTRMIYDQYGILTKKIDSNGNEIIYKSKNGFITEVIIKTGEHIQIKRNMSNLITSISGNVSGQSTYTYNGEKLISVVDNNNLKIEYIYNDNRLYRIRKADGSIIQLDWAYDGYLRKYVCSKVTSENGGYETFSYDFPNKQVIHTTNGGRKEIYKLNEFGYPIYIKDLYGYETSITTDSIGLIKSVKFPNGIKRHFTYDNLFRPIKMETDKGGTLITNYVSGQNGNLIESIIDPDGFKNRYVYDVKGNLIEQYLNNELILKMEYYPNGLMKNISDDEQTISYEYNKYGSVTHQKVKKKNGKEREWKIFYDDRNRIIKLQDENGEASLFTYGNRMETEQNKRMKKCIYFDLRNRVYKEEYFDLINGSKKTKEYVYSNGKITKILLDGILYEEFVYSNDDELTSHRKYCFGGKVAGEGVQEKYEFTRDYVTEYIKQPVRNSTSDLYSLEDKAISRKYEYSTVSGNKVVKCINELGLESSTTYDSCGNVISETFPNGYNLKTVYSKAGRVIQQLDSDNKVWDYVYKNDGSYDVILSMPTGIICISEYDRKNRLIRNKDIVNGECYFEYDGEFCILERTSNYERRIEFDSYGRKRADSVKALKEGKFIEDYRIVYDDKEMTVALFAGENDLSFYECKLDGFGRAIQVLNGNGKTKFEYDSLNRVIVKTDAKGYKTRFEYDANDEVNYVCYPDKSERFISHDVNGNLTCVKENGRIIRKATYDVENKKTSFDDVFGNKYDYFYGKDGLITKEVISISGEYDYSFTDDIRNTKNENSFVHKNVIGNTVQLLNEKSNFLYEYDCLQNIVSIEDVTTGSKIYYGYDNFGRRSYQIIDDCKIYFVYDLCGNVEQILDEQKNVLVSFEYDSLNREKKRKYQNGITETLSYNENNFIEAKIINDKIGQLLYCELLFYDDKNRLEFKVDENGNIIHYTYKQNGQLHSIEYPLNNEIWSYNLQDAFDCGYPNVEEMKGSLLYLNFDILDKANTLLRKIDLDTKIRISDYETVWKEEFEYTKKGSISSVSNPLGKILFSYDKDNRVQEKYYENFPDKKMTFTWSESGNLIQVNGVISKMNLSYNNNNRISKVDYVNLNDNSRQVINYEYDGLNRRIFEYDGENAVSYMYDGFSTEVIQKFPVFESRIKNNYVSNEGKNTITENFDFINETDYRFTDDRVYSAFGSDKNLGMNDFSEDGALVKSSREEAQRITQKLNTISSVKNSTFINILLGAENIISINENETTSYLKDFQKRNMLEVNESDTLFHRYDEFETDYSQNYSLMTQIKNFGYRDYLPCIKSFTSEDPIHDGINWYSYCSGDCVNYVDTNGFQMDSIKCRELMNDPWHRKQLLGNSTTETVDKYGCYVAGIANIFYTLDRNGILPPELKEYTTIDGVNNDKSMFVGGNMKLDSVNQKLTFQTDSYSVNSEFISTNNSYLTKQLLCKLYASPDQVLVNVDINLSDYYPNVGPHHFVGANGLFDSNGDFLSIIATSLNDNYRLIDKPHAYNVANATRIQVTTVKNKNCGK